LPRKLLKSKRSLLPDWSVASINNPPVERLLHLTSSELKALPFISAVTCPVDSFGLVEGPLVEESSSSSLHDEKAMAIRRNGRIRRFIIWKLNGKILNYP
jgi:hypothetical protein